LDAKSPLRGLLLRANSHRQLLSFNARIERTSNLSIDCPDEGLAMDKYPFITHALLASEIDMLCANGRRPPRSAKLVVTLEWATSKWRSYLLAPDGMFLRWRLWEHSSEYETGRKAYIIVAHGSPYLGRSAVGYSPDTIAKKLLFAAWRRECDAWSIDLSRSVVTRSGILNEHDIRNIERELFSTAKPVTAVAEPWKPTRTNVIDLAARRRGPR
jgi:hypothetical protein